MEDEEIPVKLSPGWVEIPRTMYDLMGEDAIRRMGGLGCDAEIRIIEGE